MSDLHSNFPNLRFRFSLRPSQTDAADAACRELAADNRRLHIVAPPGSGKTVLGLYLWAEQIRRPALVLSPNSAIQAQWAARTELFDGLQDGMISTDPKRPALLTSLTYQSLTIPKRSTADDDTGALALWQERLIDAGQAKDPLEAEVWLTDLRTHNPDHFDNRLKYYRKQHRDQLTGDGAALQTLHRSAQESLQKLREQRIGLIILDECHHLLGHWGRVLADAQALLEEPIIIGLTATPPDRGGKSSDDLQRYDDYLGPIDFDVPVPAVVKDGFLAPYQDLAYFVRPTSDELAYVANADDQLHALVDELSAPAATTDTGPSSEPLPTWLSRVLEQRLLPSSVADDWSSFAHHDPQFADAGRLFLHSRGLELPNGVPQPDGDLLAADIPELELLVPVIERYVRHQLRRSPNPVDHQRAEDAVRQLRTLGVQITDFGSQACASPVGRVLAYSRAKAAALAPIIRAERAVLGDAIRVCVISDYEKTSAVSTEIEHLLDTEAGGAIAAFRAVLADPDGNALDPILVTGSSVLVDADMVDAFGAAAREWLHERKYRVELRFTEQDGFHSVNGSGSDWSPRVYVEMITELFQRGLSKCLIGTRGLLGEGWDANRINVLIDLTTVTTSMTVNQLRGRSIRLDPQSPDKVANNWDVVCIAPEFSKGLDDYRRFIAKHRTLFGITDDGAIEKGVGHVHAALTELKPEAASDDFEGSVRLLNDDMLARASRRSDARALWNIGAPYRGEPVRSIEARPFRYDGGSGGGFPPFAKSKEVWSARSLVQAIGEAVLASLVDAELIDAPRKILVRERAGGYVRAFLEDATEEDSLRFAAALHDALGPLQRPRYVIPRHVDRLSDTFLSSLLPNIVGRYFQRRRRELVMLHAVPTVLAKNKTLVEIYQQHWNRLVSPGDAVYALRGDGQQLVAQARDQGQAPNREIHDKDIFL